MAENALVPAAASASAQVPTQSTVAPPRPSPRPEPVRKDGIVLDDEDAHACLPLTNPHPAGLA